MYIHIYTIERDMQQGGTWRRSTQARGSARFAASDPTRTNRQGVWIIASSIIIIVIIVVIIICIVSIIIDIIIIIVIIIISSSSTAFVCRHLAHCVIRRTDWRRLKPSVSESSHSKQQHSSAAVRSLVSF